MKAHRHKYAEVAPAVPLPAHGKQTYTYAIPAHSAATTELYSRVKISLGKRQLTGTVLELHSRSLPYRVKNLEAIPSSSLVPSQIELARWISQTMLGGLGYTLRLFYPPAIKKIPESPSLPVVVEKSVPARWKLAAWPERLTKPAAVLEADRLKRLRYLAYIAAKVAVHKKQVLILFPEKWQLDNAAAVFEPVFKNQLLVWQLDIPAKRANIAWQAVAAGHIRVVIGTQKSLFLPFTQLGLVIVEDEGAPAHKLWDAYPRLDNRLAAEQIASIHHADLVYSGSFPSLDLHHALETNQVNLVFDHRLDLNTQIFPLTFNDRHEKRLLPLEFIQLLETWLHKHQRVFILHNRRGTWSAIVCRSCRASLRCPECAVALAVHGHGRGAQLICHQCGYKAKFPKTCPVCHHGTLRTFGVASQRAADDLQRLLKRTRVTVLDKAALSAPGWKDNFKKWKRRHLFIGTTAAFAVLDQLNIDHAVMLMPEQSLLYPDFRSDERVIRQIIRLRELSHHDDIPIVTRYARLTSEKLGVSLNQAYAAIISERRRLKYPPFNTAVKLTWQAKTEASARKLAVSARKKIPSSVPVIVRGPFRSAPHRPHLEAESHILLLGQLTDLTSLYTPLKPNNVDINPERIL